MSKEARTSLLSSAEETPKVLEESQIDDGTATQRPKIPVQVLE
jgi:hypothetical protein